MRKNAYFRSHLSDRWPTPSELERYFLAPPGQRFFDGGNDTAGLWADGVDGTEHLERDSGQVHVHLSLCGHPDHGVLLWYRKWGGGRGEVYGSKGDLSRLRELVETLHEDLRPVGLFIPCRSAWKAVKEFIETDGQLPRSIEWVRNEDLPPEAFPDPGKPPP